MWIERFGRLERTDVDLATTAIEHLIERVVGSLGLRVDRSSPLVDARLPDGSRVNAVVPPLAVDGPCMTIRRFGARPIELEEMTSTSVAELLRWAVRSRANVVVSGGAGAGKTTLLNVLAASIPAHERIITVEDAAELRLPGDHVVRLEARPASAEGSAQSRSAHWYGMRSACGRTGSSSVKRGAEAPRIGVRTPDSIRGDAGGVRLRARRPSRRRRRRVGWRGVSMSGSPRRRASGNGGPVMKRSIRVPHIHRRDRRAARRGVIKDGVWR